MSNEPPKPKRSVHYSICHVNCSLTSPSKLIRYIVCMSSITSAVLAEDAIKAALNNYKVKKENKAAAAAAASAN